MSAARRASAVRVPSQKTNRRCSPLCQPLLVVVLAMGATVMPRRNSYSSGARSQIEPSQWGPMQDSPSGQPRSRYHLSRAGTPSGDAISGGAGRAGCPSSLRRPPFPARSRTPAKPSDATLIPQDQHRRNGVRMAILRPYARRA